MNKPLEIVVAVLKYIEEVEPDINFLDLDKQEQEELIQEAISYYND